jgi:DNA (cytosine-5)-methyltransferase 1
LEKEGYCVTFDLVYCPDYGIPQGRTRLVLFASKFGKVDLIAKTHTRENYKTVRDAISSLPPLKAGEKSNHDPLHKAQGLSKLNLKRIKQSVPGGSWKDWDESLITECHRKKSGNHYKSVYGRMEWDKPSPTLTTQCYAYGSGRFGHPEQDRAISLREAALLQTFPPEYVFAAAGNPLHFEAIGRYIGNAVPVDIGRVIAKSIRAHLMEHLRMPHISQQNEKQA